MWGATYSEPVAAAPPPPVEDVPVEVMASSPAEDSKVAQASPAEESKVAASSPAEESKVFASAPANEVKVEPAPAENLGAVTSSPVEALPVEETTKVEDLEVIPSSSNEVSKAAERSPAPKTADRTPEREGAVKHTEFDDSSSSRSIPLTDTAHCPNETRKSSPSNSFKKMQAKSCGILKRFRSSGRVLQSSQRLQNTPAATVHRRASFVPLGSVKSLPEGHGRARRNSKISLDGMSVASTTTRWLNHTREYAESVVDATATATKFWSCPNPAFRITCVALFYVVVVPYQLSFHLNVTFNVAYAFGYIVDCYVCGASVRNINKQIIAARENAQGSFTGGTGGEQSALSERVKLLKMIRPHVKKLLLCTPWDIALWAVDGCQVYIPWVRLSRIVFAGPTFSFQFGRFELEATGLSYSQARAFRLVTLVSLTCHCLACVLFLLPQLRGASHYKDPPWLVTAIEEEALATLYFRSLYWAMISCTNVGHIDVVAPVGTNLEVFAALMYCILISLVYLFVVGNCSALLLKSYQQVDRFRSKLATIDTFLRERRVRPALSKLVRQHVQDSWKEAKLDESFLDQLPRALRNEVLQDMNMRVLLRAPILAGCNSKMLALLCRVLRRRVFVKGDVLFRPGTVANELFFLESGKVSINGSSVEEAEKTSKPAGKVERVSCAELRQRRESKCSVEGSPKASALLNAFNSEKRSSLADSGGTSRLATKLALAGKAKKVEEQFVKLPGSAIGEVSFLFGVPGKSMFTAATRTVCLGIRRDDLSSVLMDFASDGTQIRHNVVKLVEKDDKAMAAKLEKEASSWQSSEAGELLFAAAKGEVESVRAMLNEKNSDTSKVNTADYDGQTALHLAAGGGHVALLEVLLKSRADVNARDRSGNTPLHEAFARGHFEAAELIHAHGGVLGYSKTASANALCLAVRGGDVDTIGRLLDFGCDPEALNDDGRTSLHVAAAVGNVAVANVLLERGASPNVRDHFGFTPTYEAVRNGHVAVAVVLHQCAGSLGLSTEEAASELNEAVRQDNMDLLKRFIINGANPSAADYDGRTCLHLAACSGNVQMVQFLMEQGVDMNACDRRGGTPLSDAVRGAQIQVVEALLNGGEDDMSLQDSADPNITDRDGRTVLHVATSMGNLELVQMLLKAGAEKDVQDNWGASPKDCATRFGYPELVELLS